MVDEKNGFQTTLDTVNTSGKKGPHSINKSALRRLSIIAGQIKGIHRMVEEEKYCIDILNQISAVRSALKSTGKLILRRHIDNCVTDVIRRDSQNSNQIIDELMEVLSKEKI
jgi:DNA-binding FrmR family transcriptional regulator